MFCISENKILKIENDTIKELPSQKIIKYRESLKEIQKRSEWKTSGQGAMFTGTAQSSINYDNYNINARITGIAKAEDRLIYSVMIDNVGNLYYKDLEKEDDERLIISKQKFHIEGIASKENKVVATVGYGSAEKHLIVFNNLPNNDYIELTDGDTVEEYISFSKKSDKIFFSTAGYSRTQNGEIVALGPRSIASYDFSENKMEEVVNSENYDYIRAKEDIQGNIYYIKRPYHEKVSNTDILKDIVFFPFRIIKAIAGMLNFFSMMFGGEPLNSRRNMATKTKQKSEKDIFVEGNMVNADKILKENNSKGEKYPGIIPRSWELIKIENNKEVVIKKGVLDYMICEDNSIIYSNGSHVLEINKDGKENLLAKTKLACNFIEI